MKSKKRDLTTCLQGLSFGKAFQVPSSLKPCSCTKNALCHAGGLPSLEELVAAVLSAAHSWGSALPAATAPLLVRRSSAPKRGQQMPKARTGLLGRRLPFVQWVGVPIIALFRAKYVREIFVSHYLPLPAGWEACVGTQAFSPARAPGKLPLQHPFGHKFNTAATFLEKKELRAGGWEGERARGRRRGVKGNPSNKRGICTVF